MNDDDEALAPRHRPTWSNHPGLAVGLAAGSTPSVLAPATEPTSPGPASSRVPGAGPASGGRRTAEVARQAWPAAVLFDLDGTLVDSERIWDRTLAELAHRLGGQLSVGARQSMVGGDLASSVAIVHADLAVVADPADSAAFLLGRTELYFARGLPWRPGAAELLAAVRAAQVPTALVTSTHRRLVDIALAGLRPGNFDVVVCGDEVRRAKPDPEPYLQAARLLGVPPGHCVAVEDSPTGVAAAEAAGCAVLAVPSVLPLAATPRRTVLTSLAGLTVADLAALLPGRAPPGGPTST